MIVRFSNLDDIAEFTKFTEKLEHSNVDIKRGNQYLDGKSFLGLANALLNVDYEVSIITSDLEEKKRFEIYVNTWKGGIKHE